MSGELLVSRADFAEALGRPNVIEAGPKIGVGHPNIDAALAEIVFADAIDPIGSVQSQALKSSARGRTLDPRRSGVHAHHDIAGLNVAHLPAPRANLPHSSREQEDGEDICGVGHQAASLAGNARSVAVTRPSVASPILIASPSDGCRWPYAIFLMVVSASPRRDAKAETVSFASFR